MRRLLSAVLLASGLAVAQPEDGLLGRQPTTLAGYGITDAVMLQAVTPGTTQTGNANLSGTIRAGAGDYTGTVKAANALVGSLTYSAPAAPPPVGTALDVAGLISGSYTYKATWTGANNEETRLGTISGTVSPTLQKVLITKPASAPPEATGWKVYRSKDGPTASWWELSGTLPLATTTYLDNTTDASLIVDATNRDSTLGRRTYIGFTPVAIVGTTNAIGAGYAALANNTTGYNNSVGAGAYALYNNTTGSNNSVGTGAYVLFSNTTGSGNSVGAGYNALAGNTTGNDNSVGAGMYAGYSSGPTPSPANAVTTSNYMTFLGYQSGLGSATQRTNSTAIGANAYVDADNTVVLGDGTVTDVLAGSTGQATVKATGLHLGTGARPTADAAHRGMIWYVAGGTGVADTAEICVKDGADAYAWVTLF